MSKKHLFFGLIALLLVHASLSHLVAPPISKIGGHTQIEPAVVFFVSAVAAGYVARAHFYPIALIAWTGFWLLTGYLLYTIAAPTASASLLTLVKNNWLAFVLSGLTTVLGVYVGQALATTRRKTFAAT